MSTIECNDASLVAGTGGHSFTAKTWPKKLGSSAGSCSWISGAAPSVGELLGTYWLNISRLVNILEYSGGLVGKYYL